MSLHLDQLKTKNLLIQNLLFYGDDSGDFLPHRYNTAFIITL